MEQQNLSNIHDKLTFLENYLLHSDTFNDDEINKRKNQAQFLPFINRGWRADGTAAQNKLDMFAKKNKDWLEETVEIPGRQAKTFN